MMESPYQVQAMVVQATEVCWKQRKQNEGMVHACTKKTNGETDTRNNVVLLEDWSEETNGNSCAKFILTKKDRDINVIL